MKNLPIRPFGARELQHLARQHPRGLSADEIIRILGVHRMEVSLPTFRKYVQLGLLPVSRRIGDRGKHQGSYGLYPVSVLRLFLRIRHMAQTTSLTLEEIRDRLAFSLKLSESQRTDAELLRLLGRGLHGAPSRHREEYARLCKTQADLRRRMSTLNRELAAASAAQDLDRADVRAA